MVFDFETAPDDIHQIHKSLSPIIEQDSYSVHTLDSSFASVPRTKFASISSPPPAALRGGGPPADAAIFLDQSSGIQRQNKAGHLDSVTYTFYMISLRGLPAKSQTKIPSTYQSPQPPPYPSTSIVHLQWVWRTWTVTWLLSLPSRLQYRLPNRVISRSLSPSLRSLSKDLLKHLKPL